MKVSQVKTLGGSAGGELIMSGSASEDGDVALDVTGYTGINVNDLRRSIRLQEWLERNARGGARYIEQILMHFGVLS